LIAEIFVVGQGAIFFILGIFGFIISVALVLSHKIKWGLGIALFSWLLQIFALDLLSIGLFLY